MEGFDGEKSYIKTFKWNSRSEIFGIAKYFRNETVCVFFNFWLCGGFIATVFSYDS